MDLDFAMIEREILRKDKKYGRYSELPNTFDASIERFERGQDRRGNTVLWILLKRGDTFYTVKYTKLQEAFFQRCIELLGFRSVEEVVGKRFIFEKYSVMGKGYMRPYPKKLDHS
ncbi:MAG: hypothetical protein NZ992_00045 [Candidatus Korarchaeum sp.]|nr:hypothetical protein [Candidatus Korarchaeum sp.]